MLDRLTLDQLRMLIAVAETGSFSAAARRLGRVQSAVSQSIQALEATLGVPLFDRGERTPKLSDAGRALLADARQTIRSTETLRAHAESIASEVEPELSLAVDAVLPEQALRASLKALSREFPHLPVTLFTEGLGGAEQRLRDRRLSRFSHKRPRQRQLSHQQLHLVLRSFEIQRPAAQPRHLRISSLGLQQRPKNCPGRRLRLPA